MCNKYTFFPLFSFHLLFSVGTVENHIKIYQFSAGVDISMAVSTEGDVYGWGKGKGGRIGLGLSDVDMLLPRRIPLGEIKAIDVECGYVHSIIVGLNGNIFMCGGMLGEAEYNNKGQSQEDNECSCDEGRLVRFFVTLLPYFESLFLSFSFIIPQYHVGLFFACNSYITGYPIPVPNFNVWQGLPEPSNKTNISTERWKKYGKYELQGRSKVMAESARWNV